MCSCWVWGAPKGAKPRGWRDSERLCVAPRQARRARMILSRTRLKFSSIQSPRTSQQRSGNNNSLLRHKPCVGPFVAVLGAPYSYGILYHRRIQSGPPCTVAQYHVPWSLNGYVGSGPFPISALTFSLNINWKSIYGHFSSRSIYKNTIGYYVVANPHLLVWCGVGD